MKVEIELTPEQWWVLTSEAELRHCKVVDLVLATSARTAEGRRVRRESVENLHGLGLSDAAIGMRLGMTTTAVAGLRRKLGLEANKRRWK